MMRTNCLHADTVVTRKRHNHTTAVKKAPSKKARYAVYGGIDDFLKSCPVFSMNEYGEKAISGRRIC